MSEPLRPDVLIIGAGPAGLTAAGALAGRVGQVLVLDREPTAGGIPRHSDHTGYGLRDLRRVMTGPNYARHLVSQAIAAGALIKTEAMATGWAAGKAVEVTSPEGRYTVEPKAMVLATGARERPRAARRIPGTRPQGVYTTGQLQNIVHLHHGKVGQKAVVVGGELVSWSAVLTLREAGCKTVKMVSQYPKAESYAAFTIPGRTVLRVPVATRSRVTRVLGKPRLEGLEVENLETGERQVIACDTAIFTGDWIPDHELVRSAGIELDPGTLGPLVDTALRTSRDGVFAAGNLLHPVDTADVAALDGRHVADQVVAYLQDRQEWGHDGVRITAETPLRWVSPGLLRPGDPVAARGRLLLWTDQFVLRPKVSIIQDETVVARKTLRWPAAPGRVFRVPFSILDRVRRDGGPVRILVE